MAKNPVKAFLKADEKQDAKLMKKELKGAKIMPKKKGK